MSEECHGVNSFFLLANLRALSFVFAFSLVPKLRLPFVLSLALFFILSFSLSPYLFDGLHSFTFLACDLETFSAVKISVVSILREVVFGVVLGTTGSGVVYLSLLSSEIVSAQFLNQKMVSSTDIWQEGRALSGIKSVIFFVVFAVFLGSDGFLFLIQLFLDSFDSSSSVYYQVIDSTLESINSEAIVVLLQTTAKLAFVFSLYLALPLFFGSCFVWFSFAIYNRYFRASVSESAILGVSLNVTLLVLALSLAPFLRVVANYIGRFF